MIDNCLPLPAREYLSSWHLRPTPNLRCVLSCPDPKLCRYPAHRSQNFKVTSIPSCVNLTKLKLARAPLGIRLKPYFTISTRVKNNQTADLTSTVRLTASYQPRFWAAIQSSFSLRVIEIPRSLTERFVSIVCDSKRCWIRSPNVAEASMVGSQVTTATDFGL